MKRVLLIILIFGLIAVPFGLLFYYFGGFKATSNQTRSIQSFQGLNFGMVQTSSQISLSLQDHYLYYSYGIIKQPEINLPLN